MVRIIEFRNVGEINEYLEQHVIKEEFEIKPVARLFENPSTRLLTNTITYVLILN